MTASAPTPQENSEPLGIKHPLLPHQPLGQTALNLQFMVPAGANPISVLDPAIFSSDSPIQRAELQQPFEELPFFQPTDLNNRSSQSPSPLSAQISPSLGKTIGSVAAPPASLQPSRDPSADISAPDKPADNFQQLSPELPTAPPAATAPLQNPAVQIQRQTDTPRLDDFTAPSPQRTRPSNPRLSSPQTSESAQQFPTPAAPEIQRSTSSPTPAQGLTNPEVSPQAQFKPDGESPAQSVPSTLSPPSDAIESAIAEPGMAIQRQTDSDGTTEQDDTGSNNQEKLAKRPEILTQPPETFPSLQEAEATQP
ncbi:MAG: hypothetical protein AAFY17_03960, partial [Cyanobacteria bacterium J06642_11]